MNKGCRLCKHFVEPNPLPIDQRPELCSQIKPEFNYKTGEVEIIKMVPEVDNKDCKCPYFILFEALERHNKENGIE